MNQPASEPTSLNALGARDGETLPAPVAHATVDSTPYDPTRAREHMRGAIAILLLSILAAVILFAFIGLWTMRITIDDTRVVLEILFAPLVGLVGAVTGFYYGSRAGKD